jgi:molybdate transport system substrate-binding protein
VDRAEGFGLVASRRDVCYFVPVILVAKGNPKGIKSLQDLLQPGLRLGLGNPEACAVGQVSAKMFQKNRIPLDAIKKNTKVETLTVNELGLQVKTGHLDAAIVWDATAAYYRDSADAIPIPRAQNVISRVTISVLKSSTSPDLAQRLVDFLAGEAGQAILKKHSYTTTLPAE